MAEYTSIPAEVDGDPIPALSDVAPTMARTVNQNATTEGIKNTYGQAKFQTAITFKTLKDRPAFLRKVGAYDRVPTPFNFTYELGGERFTLTNSICSGVNASSDQDGSASLQLTLMHEDMIDEGA